MPVKKSIYSWSDKKLLHEERRIRWSSEDIASAISLQSVSPKAYRYLRANNYPLPAMSTLRKWVSNFDVSQGNLKPVVTLMRNKSFHFNEVERISVLSFDEVYLSNKIEIDKKVEQAIGPHKACQTVMARGLISNWKQPIFYEFNRPTTKDILIQIISSLYDANFIVVAIASDMGTGNVSLWSQLNVGHNKDCFFNHPCDPCLNFFVFADIPHLIKLARNHILDNGFVYENAIINRDYWTRN